MKLTTIASSAALLSAMFAFAGSTAQAANVAVPPEKSELGVVHGVARW